METSKRERSDDVETTIVCGICGKKKCRCNTDDSNVIIYDRSQEKEKDEPTDEEREQWRRDHELPLQYHERRTKGKV